MLIEVKKRVEKAKEGRNAKRMEKRKENVVWKKKGRQTRNEKGEKNIIQCF